MPSKRRWRWFIFILVILGLILIIPAFQSYEGYVFDAETRKPLEGVVVSIIYASSPLLILGPAHDVDASETLTDQNGYFYIRKKWWTYNPWAVALSLDMVNLFKREYKPIANRPWDALIPSNMPKNVWKIEKGKRYILLGRTDPDYQSRLSNLSGMGVNLKPDQIKLLKKEIEDERNALEHCRKEGKC